MPGFSVDAKNGMLGQFRGRITHLSLHTADPGATGTSEVTSGGYARATASVSDFSAPSDGEFTLTAQKSFSGPANSAVTYFAAWDGSTYLGGGPITGDNQFNAEGAYILNVGTAFDLNG